MSGPGVGKGCWQLLMCFVSLPLSPLSLVVNSLFPLSSSRLALLVAEIKPITPTDVPSDLDIPDNYVTKTLNAQKHLPPLTYKNILQNIEWISLLALTVTPALTIYGICTTNWNTKTFWWS